MDIQRTHEKSAGDYFWQLPFVDDSFQERPRQPRAESLLRKCFNVDAKSSALDMTCSNASTIQKELKRDASPVRVNVGASRPAGFVTKIPQNVDVTESEVASLLGSGLWNSINCVVMEDTQTRSPSNRKPCSSGQLADVPTSPASSWPSSFPSDEIVGSNFEEKTIYGDDWVLTTTMQLNFCLIRRSSAESGKAATAA